MRRIFSHSKEIFFLTAETLLCFGAVYLATGLRFDFLTLGDIPQLPLRAGVFTVGMLAGLYFAGFYNFSTGSGLSHLLPKIIVGLLLASSGLWATYFLIRDLELGRGIYAIAVGLCGPALLLWRFTMQRLFGPRLFRNSYLVLGTGPLAQECARVIRDRRRLGLELVGHLAPKQQEEPAAEQLGPLLGQFEELTEVVRRHQIDSVVVAAEERRDTLPMMALLECRFAQVEVVDGLNFYEHHTQKVYVRQLNPSWLIFGHGFNISPLVLVTKRLMDVILSTLMLVLSLPILLVCGVLIKLSSPGPVFYTQVRTGRNGRPFTIIKLRSMREAGLQGDDGHPASAKDPVTWNPETARITLVGFWLRRLHLDELPQLINVLRGEMSLIGPRPERPEYIARLEQSIPYYRERHIVRPGVTGLAQVNFDYGASIQGSLEKLQYDLSYIRNLSMAGDIIILLKTFEMLLFGREERP